MLYEAIKKLYSLLDNNDPDIGNDVAHDYLTVNKARNGRSVLWYLDESQSIALYTDTLDELTAEEIEEQLC